MKKAAKAWWVVEITYQTMGGELRVASTEPTSDATKASRLAGEYSQTGYTVRIKQVPAPAAPKKPASHKPKVGSHD